MMMKTSLNVVLIIALSVLTGFAQTNVPKTISGGVVNGKALSLPSPEYPPAAIAVGACGSVNISVLIGIDGLVETAEAISGHPLLRSAAVGAAEKSKFRPTQLSGQPVKVSGVIVYSFRCGSGESELSTKSNDYPLARRMGVMTKVGPNESLQKNPNPPIEPQSSIEAGVVNGKALSLPSPAYPAAAKAIGASGSVNVRVVIDENGDVVFANATSGHPLLRSVSEKAALESKFVPTKLSGQPVKVSGSINYVFPQGSTASADIQPDADRLSVSTLIGLSSGITMLIRMNEDSQLDALTNTAIYEMAQSFGDDDFPDEVEFVRELPNADRSRRGEILTRLLTKLSNEVTGDENHWYMAFGCGIGEVLSEKTKRVATANSNSSALIQKIFELNDLHKSAPKTFPDGLNTLVKELFELTSVPNVYAPQNINLIEKKVDAIRMFIFED